MVKSDILPIDWCMAGAAVLPELPVVSIVLSVARSTIHRGALEHGYTTCVLHVTLPTSHRLVFANQGKGR